MAERSTGSARQEVARRQALPAAAAAAAPGALAGEPERALDTTVVVDRERRVVYRDERPTRYATLYEVVAPLLR